MKEKIFIRLIKYLSSCLSHSNFYPVYHLHVRFLVVKGHHVVYRGPIQRAVLLNYFLGLLFVPK